MFRAVLLAALFTMAPQTAQAQMTAAQLAGSQWCEAAEGESEWYLRRVAMHELNRVRLDLTCHDGELLAIRARAETRCAPRYCTWGNAEITRLEGQQILAIFETFTARRVMWIMLDGEAISVVVDNDFNQPGRQDERMEAVLPRRR